MSDHKIISINVLQRLVDKLPAAALASLPIAQLPDSIPVKIVDGASADKAKILEDMMLRHQQYMLQLRHTIKDSLGTKALEAYDLAQQDHSTGHLSLLKSNLHEYKAYKKYFNFQQKEEGAARLLNLLEEQHPNILEIRHDYFELLGAQEALQQRSKTPGEIALRLELSSIKLSSLIEELRALLSQYFTERLALCVSIMTGFSSELENDLGHWNSLKQQAVTISGELEESEKLLTPKIYRSPAPSEPGQYLSLSLESLREKLASVQLPYSEDELTHWMDILVDYHCHFEPEAKADPLFEKARKHIYRLLSYHFESELITSLPVSSSEKIHHDSKQLQGFLNKSRHYLETYLKERSSEALQSSPSSAAR